MIEPTAAEQTLFNEFEVAVKKINEITDRIDKVNMDPDVEVVVASNLAIARALVLVATVIDHRGTDIANELKSLEDVATTIREVRGTILMKSFS
jgi:hypothetical protein